MRKEGEKALMTYLLERKSKSFYNLTPQLGRYKSPSVREKLKDLVKAVEN